MKKVIFLDIDGVLVSMNHLNTLRDEDYDEFIIAPFNPDCVKNILTVINETGAEIVISSMWRCLGIERLQYIFNKRNVNLVVSDITPSLGPNTVDFANRGKEIKEWLKKNPGYKYCILDDEDSILKEQNNYYVKTTLDKGLTKEDSDKAIFILNNL